LIEPRNRGLIGEPDRFVQLLLVDAIPAAVSRQDCDERDERDSLHGPGVSRRG
jgi:hypothetical protein